jgi:hypothetical protein
MPFIPDDDGKDLSLGGSPTVEHRVAAAKLPPDKLETALRAFNQGWMGGFSDEMAGALKVLQNAPADWLFEQLHPEAKGEQPGALDLYRQGRDQDRAANAAAERANPNLYTAMNVAGSAAPAVAATLATGGAAAPAAANTLAARALPLAVSVGQGAAAGVGYSDADATRGDLRGLGEDAALGAGLGVAGQVAGSTLGAGLSRARAFAVRKAEQAIGKAAEQAAKETGEAVASARGALGAETQKGSRYIENLMRLEESMTPEQKSVYAQLQASGVVPDLQQSVAQGTLESLPGQAGKIASRRAEADALTQALSDDTRALTSENLEPTLGKDALSFARRYGGAPAGAAAGWLAGNTLGLDEKNKTLAMGAGGLIFSRARAGKALRDRLAKPGNQLALANALREMTGPAVNVAGLAIPRTAVLPATAALLAARRAPAISHFVPDEDQP